MKRLAGFWKKIADGWTVQRIAAVLIVVGLVVFVVGVVNKHCACADWPNFGETLNDVILDFYANVSVDCLSIAFAILVIDRLNERREEEQAKEQLKAQLIRDMGSTDNGIALKAVGDLRANGWLEDGSLRGAKLAQANLQGAVLKKADLQKVQLGKANLRKADLSSANLQGVNLSGANLEEAFLTQANLKGSGILNEKMLVKVKSLWGATMSNTRKYNGRFNLPWDKEGADLRLETTIGEEVIDTEPRTPHFMADFYGVSLEEYLAGQEWAREHLADLRRKAGLNPDTGLLMEPTNGTEPQPADAPARPAPRRNGHKASMVAHRVRR